MRSDLLLVVFDCVGRARLRSVRILTELSQRSSLAQQVPALIELNLQFPESLAIFIAEMALPVESLLHKEAFPTSMSKGTKFIELVCIGLNAGRTNLNPDGTRRHIRAALAAGPSREEILFVLKVASVMAIHSCMFGSPILLEEASAGSLNDAGKLRASRLREAGGAIPAVEKMKAIGKWNEEWDSLLFFNPVWTEQYMETVIELYTRSVLPLKHLELLCLAFDASYTHMYAPGTRRHIKNAMNAGATFEEIIEVLKLSVIQGVQACNLGVPILAEELGSFVARQKTER